jgi:DNA ligase N terminus.
MSTMQTEKTSNGLLETFAETAERVAATTKKLEKAALLGAYLRELNDEDLARAARYFAGHQFALHDARTTNVGSSVLRDALSEATGIAVEELRPRLRAARRCGRSCVRSDS